jgi:hypothetical protein
LIGIGAVAFLLRESGRVSVGSDKGQVAELRSLLKFLFVCELMPRLLTRAVPPVADGARGAFSADLNNPLISTRLSPSANYANHVMRVTREVAW